MHELSIAQQIADIALQHIEEAGGQPATAITLRIGALSCVHEDALRFSMALVAKETLIEGAELRIITVPVSVYCPSCDQVVELPGIQRFRCPLCDTPTADVRSGQELEIDTIELHA
ncbi:MAG: hydrogenase maturation nickel metallochaperone HypA [Pirellulaceae bacterium]